ncbi:hypothetical protein C8Q79DRAFT_1006574 [Trametes meyenii]|nr:hypothetical protein C8Q79DRAFT_1006574 [Trametes meyenii]
MSSSSSASSSDSEQASSSSPRPQKRPRVSDEASTRDVSSDESSDAESEADANEASDVPVLSHAEKRRQKKKEERQSKNPVASEDNSGSKKGKGKVQNTVELPPSKVPKRQNSVWVGNLSFKTTPDSLRNFFHGVGEITRIHMPMKMATGGPDDKRPRQQNRGLVADDLLSCPFVTFQYIFVCASFAYVDFSAPDAKTIAITLSENPLDGRRLLIKDGDDFNGRPAPSTAANADGTESATPKNAGLTKTAQKILRIQKQPPGPTLFFGNLGFETTEKSLKDLLDSHKPKDGDAKWIRKVRMGTFEDSGKCKGCVLSPIPTLLSVPRYQKQPPLGGEGAWCRPYDGALRDRAHAVRALPCRASRGNTLVDAPQFVLLRRWAFVDFTTPEHATAALTNPRNHQLDGRKLVVEYASPEAVRRGGGGGAGGPPRTDRVPRTGGKRDRNARGGDADGGADQGAEDGQRPAKKQRAEAGDEGEARGPRGRKADAVGKGGKAPRPRAKPGAALALAKREDVAIQPSQGKKIVF